MDLKQLKENKKELIELKKAEKKFTNGINAVIGKGSSAIKGIYKNNETELDRTIVANTYYWMDNHDDVHSKSVFKKSISERASKVFHLHDHEFKITAKVGEPIGIYEKEIAWRDLNVDKDGTTEALFMDTQVMKEYNLLVFNAYKNNLINQHSVGMQYDKIDLAINDEQYEEEYKVWTDNIGLLGNPERAEDKGYFWLVREAKLIEISAVLMGSNELTPTLGETKEAAAQGTAEKEAEQSLQRTIKFYNNLKI